ncbi:MAG: LamG domain-containing protein, partial [Actinomycetota bacterium]
MSTAGLIGYPLKLVAESRSTPDMNFGFTTASTGCRVDNYLNFLYYDSTTQGKCTVSVTKLPATPLLGTVSVLQRLVAKVVATTDVTFYPQSVSSGLSSGLVGFWPFNSSTSMGWNSVTGKVDLKVVGKPSFRQFGKFGGAVTLNGAGDYLAGNGSGDSVPNLPTANGKYTMSLWMLPNKFDSSRGLMGWGTYGSDGDRKTNAFRMKSDLAPATTEISGGLVNYWWGKDAAWDAYQYRMTYVDGQGRTVCCKSAFTETKWVHVAVTYDGTTRTIYYDGKMVASDVPGVANGVANKNFRIGATSISNKEFFSGSIDDAAVWNRALTSDEIAGLSKMSVGQNNPALPANFKPFVPTPCSEIGGFCEVGDKTPEGGTVFFVGDFVDQLNNQPMKYLAFAPDDLRSQIYGPGTSFVKGYESLCGGRSNPIPEADKTEIGWG